MRSIEACRQDTLSFEKIPATRAFPLLLAGMYESRPVSSQRLDDFIGYEIVASVDLFRRAFVLQFIHLDGCGSDDFDEMIEISVVSAMNVRTPMIGQTYGFMNMDAENPILQPLRFPYIIVQSHPVHHHAMADIVP